MSYTEGRLVRKAELANGLVVKTSFYVYNHGELLPHLKYVFKGDKAELGDEKEAEEKAEFLAKFELNMDGREKSAVRFAACKFLSLVCSPLLSGTHPQCRWQARASQCRV